MIYSLLLLLLCTAYSPKLMLFAHCSLNCMC